MADDEIARCMASCPEHLDFPTAWAIQKKRQLEHHERCSSVPGWHPLSGPAFLCDCGAVKEEYARIRQMTLIEDASRKEKPHG